MTDWPACPRCGGSLAHVHEHWPDGRDWWMCRCYTCGWHGDEAKTEDEAVREAAKDDGRYSAGADD